MGEKIVVWGIASFVVLVAGLALLSIPRLAAREKECNQKDGVLIKGSGGFMCIKKDVVIK